jgi:mevalonate kinase
VAKKRKGARPTKKASRSVKKKVARKAAPRRVAAERRTGLEDPTKADFNPLKELMRDHITRLESAKVSNEKIANALRILRTAQSDLTGACLPTMELQTS